MASSILEYLSTIEAKMGTFSKRRRLAFAVWCCCKLWNRFSDSLRIGIGSDKTNELSGIVDGLWQYVIYLQEPSVDVVDRAREALKSIESSDAELNAGSELANFGIVELLGCIQNLVEVFENGSAKPAAQCAEHVINWVDHELAFVSEAKDPLTHPEMLKELDCQNKMIDHLNDSVLITEEDKSRFRP